MKTRFSLPAVAPFSLELTAWALRREGRNEIDRWDGKTYRRVLTIDGAAVETAVTQTGGVEEPRLTVEAASAVSVPRARQRVGEMLEKMLGLAIDLGDFYRFASRQPRLGRLARRFRGLKPPRFPSIWEAIVNAVSCQQLSLRVGILLMNRLSARFGLPAGEARSFPRCEELARAGVADVKRLGYNTRKAQTIIQVAGAVADGRLDLEAIAGLDDESAVSFLTKIPGIGRWSAQYVLLRGLRRVNVFPADDVGFQRRLATWLHLEERLDYDGVHRAIHRWRACGGIVYFFMLLNHLAEKGCLSGQDHSTPVGGVE